MKANGDVMSPCWNWGPARCVIDYRRVTNCVCDIKTYPFNSRCIINGNNDIDNNSNEKKTINKQTKKTFTTTHRSTCRLDVPVCFNDAWTCRQQGSV